MTDAKELFKKLEQRLRAEAKKAGGLALLGGEPSPIPTVFEAVADEIRDLLQEEDVKEEESYHGRDVVGSKCPAKGLHVSIGKCEMCRQEIYSPGGF